jgi:hypothetical protein
VRQLESFAIECEFACELALELTLERARGLLAENDQERRLELCADERFVDPQGAKDSDRCPLNSRFSKGSGLCPGTCSS